MQNTQPLPLGYNADAKFIGSLDAFLRASQHGGMVTIIDDHDKHEATHELRMRNPSMHINQRHYYEGAEGDWENVQFDGRPQTPKRMYDVLTAGYRPDYRAWLNLGNEANKHGDDLKRMIDFYCGVVELCIHNGVRVIVGNLQAVNYTLADMEAFKPLFVLLHAHPDLAALGLHEYFTLMLPCGVGVGDWSELLKFGKPYSEPFPTRAMLSLNHAEAHIGRGLMFVEAARRMNLYPIRIFETEVGFDRINNLTQLSQLDAMNSGRQVSGIQTLKYLIHRHAPDMTFAQAIMLQLRWLSEVLWYADGLCLYNWSHEDAWKEYNYAPEDDLWELIAGYNASIMGTFVPLPIPTPPPPPVIVTPPTQYSTLAVTARANLRVAPIVGSESLGVMPIGILCEALEDVAGKIANKGKYIHVQFRGVEGYISGAYLKVANNE